MAVCKDLFGLRCEIPHGGFMGLREFISSLVVFPKNMGVTKESFSSPSHRHRTR